MNYRRFETGMIVLTAVLALIISLPLKASASEAKEKYDIAMELLKGGEPKSAVLFFDKSIAENSHYWPAYLGRGDALIRLGYKSWAADDYKQALKLNPGCREAQVKLERIAGPRVSSTTRTAGTGSGMLLSSKPANGTAMVEERSDRRREIDAERKAEAARFAHEEAIRTGAGLSPFKSFQGEGTPPMSLSIRQGRN